jgi:ParB/RepB/Spo0J family partition protein
MKKAAEKKNPVAEANEFYESEVVNGRLTTVEAVEKKFGLKRFQLVNFRKGSPKAAAVAHPQGALVSIGGATTANGASLIRVPLNWVKVCPLNPRKKVNPAGIDEMARSILEHGIIQPPVARENPKGSGLCEIVFGQRRLCGLIRAREMARAEKLPEPRYEIDLLLREMDDNTVREEAWVENLQRVDVSVREEVRGFEELLSLRDAQGNPIYSVTRLAEKLGKSRSGIAGRLKMSGVPEPLWDALEAGEVGVRQLELVGCIPSEKERERLASGILKPKYRNAPLTVKETRDLIRSDFMVSLRGVEWDLKDAELVPVKMDAKGVRISGGACSDCLFRTGNDEALQESLSDGGGSRGTDKNSCMLPTCFQAKKAACWKRAKASTEEAGGKVLAEAEAKKVFSQWGSGNEVERSSGMVVLSSKPGYNETGHHAAEETLPTWAEMLGDVPAEEVVLARNPKTGAICRLMPAKRAIELAEKALKEQGKESPFAKRKKEKGQQPEVRERNEWEVARIVSERSEKEVMAWLRKQSEDGTLFGALAQEELAVAMALEAMEYQGATDVCEMLGIPVAETTDRDMEEIERKLEAEVRASAKKGPPWWLLVELLCCVNNNVGHTCTREGMHPYLKRLLEVIGVPLDAIVSTAKAEIEAEDASRLEAAKVKKSAKKGK